MDQELRALERRAKTGSDEDLQRYVRAALRLGDPPEEVRLAAYCGDAAAQETLARAGHPVSVPSGARAWIEGLGAFGSETRVFAQYTIATRELGRRFLAGEEREAAQEVLLAVDAWLRGGEGSAERVARAEQALAGCESSAYRDPTFHAFSHLCRLTRGEGEGLQTGQTGPRGFDELQRRIGDRFRAEAAGAAATPAERAASLRAEVRRQLHPLGPFGEVAGIAGVTLVLGLAASELPHSIQRVSEGSSLHWISLVGSGILTLLVLPMLPVLVFVGLGALREAAALRRERARFED